MFSFLNNRMPKPRSDQTWLLFSNRCATLGISNLPILWFFGTRNDIFIWFTGWSFQRFNILHRHIARVVVLFLIGHAAAKTHNGLNTTLPKPNGMLMYGVAMKMDWLRWGVTVCHLGNSSSVCALTFGATRPSRRWESCGFRRFRFSGSASMTVS